MRTGSDWTENDIPMQHFTGLYPHWVAIPSCDSLSARVVATVQSNWLVDELSRIRSLYNVTFRLLITEGGLHKKLLRYIITYIGGIQNEFRWWFVNQGCQQ